MKALTLTLGSICIAALSSCSTTNTAHSDLNPVIADKNYPTAFPYQNSTTQVISPYKPYNVINIKGMKPGHLCRDISTAKLNKNTGKPITSTAKIFKIPQPKAKSSASQN